VGVSAVGGKGVAQSAIKGRWRDTNIKPLLGYYGGKQRIASWVAGVIWEIPHLVYVEPFAGGAAVLFRKGRPPGLTFNQYTEVLNDINDGVIALYRVAREQPELFTSWVRLSPYSQGDFRRAKDIFKRGLAAGEVMLAWATFVVYNQSFANNASTWGTSVWQNVTSRYLAYIGGIPAALERIRQCVLASEDFRRCIARWDSPHTLFYVDPPYVGTDHDWDYSEADHEELLAILDNCRGSYILSGYAGGKTPASCQRILYKDARCSATGSGKTRRADRGVRGKTDLDVNFRRESLWICDRSSGISDDAWELLEKQWRRHGTN